MSGLRRLASLTAAMTLTLGGMVAVSAAPAQGAPEGCALGFGHYQEAGGYIVGYRYWYCTTQDDIPLPVSILRYMSPGVYQTVASGTGEAVYYCGGTLYNVYHTTGTSDFAILCS